MHVSEPKSSKGCNRNKLAQGADSSGLHPSPLSPRPPLHDRCMRSRGLLVKHSSLRSTSDIPELVEAVEAMSAPVLTLNKYRVLPSIESKPEKEQRMRGMKERTSELSLTDNLHLQSRLMWRGPRLSSIRTRTASKCSPDMGVLSEVLCSPGSPLAYVESPENPEDMPAFDNESSLVLAIRTPCGSRIEHRFNPNNTLRSVIAAAEAQQGRRYQHSLVETMDMPRRSFTDLNMTLAQCGIPNRSVLYISHADFEDD